MEDYACADCKALNTTDVTEMRNVDGLPPYFIKTVCEKCGVEKIHVNKKAAEIFCKIHGVVNA